MGGGGQINPMGGQQNGMGGGGKGQINSNNRIEQESILDRVYQCVNRTAEMGIKPNDIIAQTKLAGNNVLQSLNHLIGMHKISVREKNGEQHFFVVKDQITARKTIRS